MTMTETPRRCPGTPAAAGRLAVVGLLAGALPAPAVGADLGVLIEGVAHDRGALYLALYDRPETFLDEAHAVRRGRCPARLPGPVRFTWHGLAPGDYAVTVYHDEDGNGRLDRLMGVAPAEGFGLSNNLRLTGKLAGRPSFEQARVRVPREGLVLSVTLRYPPPPEPGDAFADPPSSPSPPSPPPSPR